MSMSYDAVTAIQQAPMGEEPPARSRWPHIHPKRTEYRKTLESMPFNTWFQVRIEADTPSEAARVASLLSNNFARVNKLYEEKTEFPIVGWCSIEDDEHYIYWFMKKEKPVTLGDMVKEASA